MVSHLSYIFSYYLSFLNDSWIFLFAPLWGHIRKKCYVCVPYSHAVQLRWIHFFSKYFCDCTLCWFPSDSIKGIWSTKYDSQGEGRIKSISYFYSCVPFLHFLFLWILFSLSILFPLSLRMSIELARVPIVLWEFGFFIFSFLFPINQIALFPGVSTMEHHHFQAAQRLL